MITCVNQDSVSPTTADAWQGADGRQTCCRYLLLLFLCAKTLMQNTCSTLRSAIKFLPTVSLLSTQVNVTAFSASGVKTVTDRAWAETPSQKLARLTAAAEAGPAALPGPAADAAQKRAAATAQVWGNRRSFRGSFQTHPRQHRAVTFCWFQPEMPA